MARPTRHRRLLQASPRASWISGITGLGSGFDEAQVKGLISEAEVEDELAAIEQKRAPLLQRRDLVLMKKRGLDDQQARLEATEARLADMRESLDGLTFEERRAIVTELVDRVTIDTAEGTIELRTILLQGLVIVASS